jgi:hypothetical protein
MDADFVYRLIEKEYMERIEGEGSGPGIVYAYMA